MALIGLGVRSVSRAPASVGGVKAMIRSLDASEITRELDRLLAQGEKEIRACLVRFARSAGVEL